MKLPNENAASMVRVSYGWYVWRRLIRKEEVELASTAHTANRALLAAHRGVEDAELPVQEAIADRDADDDDLDETTRYVRLQLAARELGADKKQPYTSIFHKGIDYYTAANLSQQTTRYGELVANLANFLPLTDPLRVEAVAQLQQQLASWKESESSVETARNGLAVIRTQHDAATEQWEVSMERIYGALSSKYGKKKAEQFFPRAARKRPGESSKDDETEG